MAIIWTAPRPGEEGSVGHVRATLTITNRADQVLAERGLMRPEEVRTVTLDNVLVDTGATLLGLPADVIARLGLAYRQDITAQTATGPRRTRRFRDAEITLLGRSGTFDCVELPGDCVELPGGASALLGVIPLETLGIEPDVRNGTLHLLPEGPDESHILAYYSRDR
jgi:predicted aspartyl protease